MRAGGRARAGRARGGARAGARGGARAGAGAGGGGPGPGGGGGDPERSDVEARLGIGRKAREAQAAGGADPPPPPSLPEAKKMAAWGEKSLLPEGFDRMSPAERVSELWMGERGALYWMNWLAVRAVGVLAVLWILFRFVGPALHLYDLKGLLDAPTL